MKLLKNRPFAALCIIFITVSFFIYDTDPKLKLILALVLFLCLLGTLLIKKKTPKSILLSLCILFALFGIASQFIGIDVRRRAAESHIGNREAIMLVTDSDTTFKSSNEYSVEILEIDGKRVRLSANLITDDSVELEVGDLIYTETKISLTSRENNFIGATIYDDDTCILISKNNKSLKIFFSRLRSGLSEYMNATLGDELSSLARGFLLSDKSDLPANIIKDFRRTGVSHLLAVSGFHISIIIAFSETIMRALLIPKRTRCVLLALLSLFFLGMTGFAISASRSVAMLLILYFCILLVQEYDSLTSLFLSISIIILLSPRSVRDVGLWLSFFATLGIIAVYSPLSSRFNKKEGRTVKDYCRSFFKKLILAFLLTFICNIFICVVIWLVFGEISLTALISNPPLSPLSAIFVILIPIALVVANIPIIGSLLIYILSFLARLILAICEFFSDIPGGVISLRYPFAPFIVILMTLALTVMLFIELKKKWTILLPPLISCAIFALCLLCYNILYANKLNVSYYAQDDNEAIIITKGNSASICDFSFAPSYFPNELYDIYHKRLATEISEYTVTHYHKGHPLLLERLFNENLIISLYLPYPTSAEEREIASDILISAADSDVNVYLYTDEERLPTLDNSYISVMRFENSEAHPALCAVIGYRSSVLVYLNSDLQKTELIQKMLLSSDHLIFGRHGENYSSEIDLIINRNTLKTVFFASRDIYRRSDIDFGDSHIYIPPKDDKKLLFELVLD